MTAPRRAAGDNRPVRIHAFDTASPKGSPQRHCFAVTAASGTLAVTRLPLSTSAAAAGGVDGTLTAARWSAMRARVADGRCVSATPVERDPVPSHGDSREHAVAGAFEIAGEGTLP